MAAMWWSKGAVTARLLTLRRANSSGKAAPKRHEQQDFQAAAPAGSWKVPSSRDLASYTPSLYVLQKGPAGGSDSSSSDSGDGTDDEQQAAVSGPSSSSSGTAQYWLAHTKPRKGASASAVLKLRALTGSDARDSQQVGARARRDQP
jgi:hypothetical protein